MTVVQLRRTNEGALSSGFGVERGASCAASSAPTTRPPANTAPPTR